MKLKRIWKLAVAVFFLVTGGLTLLIFKKNTKPIYRGLRYFLDHESYQIALKKLKGEPEFKRMIDEKYNQYKPVPWNQMKEMAPGTLGYEFAKFMNNPDVTALEALPEAKVEIDEETDYIRQRIRLTHDIHHVLCGFPATEIGEMGISALYIAQINSPLNAFVLAVGLVKCTAVSPSRLPELMTVISEGWQQGITSRNIFAGRWEDMWETPVDQIRKEWNLKPSALDFIETPFALNGLKTSPSPLPNENKILA